MACVDYGALAWKNGKALGKRVDLFEDIRDVLGFEIDLPSDVTYGYITVGNKNFVFGFHRAAVVVYDVKNDKIETVSCEPIKRIDCGLCVKAFNIYREEEFEYFGQKFTIKTLNPYGVFLFKTVLDGDKYEVLFGYGVDPYWFRHHIPENYNYNKKTLKFLNSHDNKNYQLDKNYIKNKIRKERTLWY